MRKRILNSDDLWAVAFIGLGLIALSMSRPWPIFPRPAHFELVKGADGTEVAVPLPLRGVVGSSADFLQKTHALELLHKGGGKRDRALFAQSIMSIIYRRVLGDPNLWNEPDDIESILASDEGYIYFDRRGALRRLGLAELSASGLHRRDDEIFAMTQVMNAAVGQENKSGVFISAYERAYAELGRDLHLTSAPGRPSLIQMVTSDTDWNRVWASGENDDITGVADGTSGYRNAGREAEAERILAMNPDVIVLRVGSLKGFMRDARWQGLAAFHTHRVYENIALLKYDFDLDCAPLGARWIAEIAHTDRLQPKLRELIRAYFFSAYGYRFSDDEIDKILHVEENKKSASYTRFMRDERVDGEKRVLQ